MDAVVYIGEQIISVIIQGLGYGFIAGLAFYFLSWGVQQVLKIFRT
jgi:hypothetical protein